MRLLNGGARPFVYVAAVLTFATVAMPAAGHPPNEPDNGVDESEACTLWAGDVDETNTTSSEVDDSIPELCALAVLTDIPLDSPPVAVERWNRGDLDNFPKTGSKASAYPTHATRKDGLFIRDAYTEIFTVQPSTKARLSPTDQPLYVASDGTLLGTVDYRIGVPADDLIGHERVIWRLLDHEINETRLLIDGTLESDDAKDRTPVHEYSLPNRPNVGRTFTLEADINVSLRKQMEVCETAGENGSCRDWNVTVEYPTEQLTVRDSLDVVEYDLIVSGVRAQYPNGDLGLMVYKNHPWLGYSVPGGDVQGIWRFYAARDDSWDRLVTATDDGKTAAHSPLHPLAVNAFPIETQPSATPHQHVQILEAFGAETEPPTLAEDVHLDVETDPYTASYRIASRTATTEHDLVDVTAFGLVRGVDADIDTETLRDVPIYRSNLTLSILEENGENLTVRVDLRENSTGKPIDTSDRGGYITLRDERIDTTENGTVTITIDRDGGGVTATFVPGRWWHYTPGYTGDSDVVYARGGGWGVARVLLEFAVPFSLFLLGVFIVDRFTQWHVWPPWRRL